jgi:hypothetical protein
LQAIVPVLAAGTLFVVSSVEAHLLRPLPRLAPVGLLGVARVSSPGTAHPPHEMPRPSPSPAPKRLTLAPGVLPAPERVVAPAPAAAPKPSRSLSVSTYVQTALEHLAANRYEQALEAARAVSFADPQHLIARLITGQALLSLRASQGRRVLRGLAEEIARLPPDEAVPSSELTVGQLADAVRLLLDREAAE